MEEELWKVLDSYYKDHAYPFTQHHLDSYREFLRVQIPRTIRLYNPMTMIKKADDGSLLLEVKVYIGGKEGTAFYIDRPTVLDSTGKPVLLTPHQARLCNLTYETHLYADIFIEYTGAYGDKTKEFNNVCIGSIPLMVHSEPCILHGQGPQVLRELGECIYDAGGYFIVDGKEKVIVSQERITTNRLFAEPSKDPNFNYKGLIRCTGETGESALIPRTIEFMIVDPNIKRDPNDPDVIKELLPYRGAILVSLPSVKGRLPLTTVFRALGVETDKAIAQMILGNLDGELEQELLLKLRPSFVHGTQPIQSESGKVHPPIYTQEQAIENLKYRVYFDTPDYVKNVLVNDVFPNMGSSYEAKAKFLGHCVREFLTIAYGWTIPSDRDSYLYKRIDLSGFLLAQLFQEAYVKFRNTVRNVLDREYNYGPWKNTEMVEEMVRNDNLNRIFSSTLIGKTMTRSLKGMWGVVEEDPEQGKVQDLARISYVGFLSHLRRVNIPLDRSIKIVGPHRLHPQQYGMMCPFESPDGASIGYLKNFAMTCHVTFGCDPEPLKDILIHQLKVLPLTNLSSKIAQYRETTKVFVNGLWIGATQNPIELTYLLRLYRRNGILNPFVSVSFDISANILRIQTEPGRPCRPLMIVRQGQLMFQSKKGYKSWYDLIYGTTLPEAERNENRYYTDTWKEPGNLRQMNMKTLVAHLEEHSGCVEFLDVEEENTSLLAMYPKDVHSRHTHCEIHPSVQFSVVTNNIAFAQHNQAPRNYFHGAQGKQAIGMYATNFDKRFDTAGYILHYGQKPLIATRNSHYTNCDQMPYGVNAIVAVATYSGFNQEDAVIINKNAIDRGFFQLTVFKSMVAQEEALNPRERVVFKNPIALRNRGVEVQSIKHANYTLLDEQGIVKPESYVPRGETAAIIGMCHVRNESVEVQRGLFKEIEQREVIRDVSITTDVLRYGTVDRVFVGNQGYGKPERICKVRFRKVRRPELGDKVCSRMAQKGVCGMILPAENMPYTKDGIIPDIIMNPHAFPSRMTIGQMMECVFAKLVTLEGTRGDGTIFIPLDMGSVQSKLEDLGYEKYGNEVMYDGRSGEQIETDIFIGPTYYLRLKHMVADKINARGFGPRVIRTHQPTSGRSAGGGLRIGEMERDALLAHGASQFIKESMMERSDKYTFAVCRQCGLIADYNPQHSIRRCPGCQANDVVVIQTPYSFKLLSQEMEAMSIQMRLSPEAFERIEEDDEMEVEDEMEGGASQQMDDESTVDTKSDIESKSETDSFVPDPEEFGSLDKTSPDDDKEYNAHPQEKELEQDDLPLEKEAESLDYPSDITFEDDLESEGGMPDDKEIENSLSTISDSFLEKKEPSEPFNEQVNTTGSTMENKEASFSVQSLGEFNPLINSKKFSGEVSDDATVPSPFKAESSTNDLSSGGSEKPSDIKTIYVDMSPRTSSPLE
jgi:DNA-directed RNA polymerase II subunit RPB2